MAAIIDTQRATKNANEPSRVPTPMSIPFICRTATAQDPAASASVAVSAPAVVRVLPLVMAAVPEIIWTYAMSWLHVTHDSLVMQPVGCVSEGTLEKLKTQSNRLGLARDPGVRPRKL